MLKKDGKSLRLVHRLEPLNEVTTAYSGVPPATETLAAQFAGRACGGMLDLYVGYCKGNWKLDLAELAGGPKSNILVNN